MLIWHLCCSSCKLKKTFYKLPVTNFYMNISTKQYPFYLKSTVILFGLMLLVFALFTLKGILAPIAFALIIAILLNEKPQFK